MYNNLIKTFPSREDRHKKFAFKTGETLEEYNGSKSAMIKILDEKKIPVSLLQHFRTVRSILCVPCFEKGKTIDLCVMLLSFKSEGEDASSSCSSSSSSSSSNSAQNSNSKSHGEDSDDETAEGGNPKQQTKSKKNRYRGEAEIQSDAEINAAAAARCNRDFFMAAHSTIAQHKSHDNCLVNGKYRVVMVESQYNETFSLSINVNCLLAQTSRCMKICESTDPDTITVPSVRDLVLIDPRNDFPHADEDDDISDNHFVIDPRSDSPHADDDDDNTYNTDNTYDAKTRGECVRKFIRDSLYYTAADLPTKKDFKEKWLAPAILDHKKKVAFERSEKEKAAASVKEEKLKKVV